MSVCPDGRCGSVLSAATSLTQGQTFAEMTKNFHGGKRSRKNNSRRNRNMKGGRKSRRSHRRNTRRSRRSYRRNNMMGGAASYPNEFSETLPQNMHEAARITSLDKAFAQLPEFAGKYGTGQAGGSRRTRRSRRGGLMYGGMADVGAPSMILSAAEEPKAFLNPQWYNENQVIPSFKGPENAYAASQQAAQQTYAAKGGKRSRRHRKGRKASRKGRKNSRKSRK